MEEENESRGGEGGQGNKEEKKGKKKEEVDATVGPRARLVQIIGTCRIPRLPRYSFNFAACLSLNSSQVVREKTLGRIVLNPLSALPPPPPLLSASFRLYSCIELTLEWNVTVSSRTNCPGLFCAREPRKGRENFYFGLETRYDVVESIGKITSLDSPAISL